MDFYFTEVDWSHIENIKQGKSFGVAVWLFWTYKNRLDILTYW